jgi:hypothetical protein
MVFFKFCRCGNKFHPATKHTKVCDSCRENHWIKKRKESAKKRKK